MSWLPFLIDGMLLGAMLALGAVGLTLTYSILGFANFTHGDLITWGAYCSSRGRPPRGADWASSAPCRSAGRSSWP